MPRIAYQCEECGKDMMIWPCTIANGQHRYCSQICHSLAMEKPRVLTNCQICGKAYMANPTRFKWAKGKYCSRQCAVDSTRREGNYRWGQVAFICEACGKRFSVISSKSNRANRFCSLACRHSVRQKQCPECGELFRPEPNQVERGRGKYCSKHCSSQSLTRITGSQHWNWRGGWDNYPEGWVDALKDAIRQRDSYKCKLCGKPEKKRQPPVHHIDYNKENLNPSNLMTLCWECHGKTNGKRDYWKARLTLLNVNWEVNVA